MRRSPSLSARSGASSLANRSVKPSRTAQQGGVTRRFGFTHGHRDQGECLALSPLHAGRRVVVAGFDAHLHGQERAAQKGFARFDRVGPAGKLGLTVEARQGATVFSSAGTQDQIDLAQAVIITRLVAQLAAIEVPELDALRRTLELDARGLVRDGFDHDAFVLSNQYLAETRGDAELDIFVQHVAGDHAARAVRHERDVLLAVGEHQMPTFGKRQTVHGDRATSRFGATQTGENRAILQVQVGGWLHRHAHQIQPRHGQRSQASTRDQHIEPLQHAIRIATHAQHRGQHQTEGDPAQELGAAGGLRFDRDQRGSLQLTLKMQLCELERTDSRISGGLLGQGRSAQCAFPNRAIDGHEHAPNRALHVLEVPPIARAP